MALTYEKNWLAPMREPAAASLDRSEHSMGHSCQSNTSRPAKVQIKGMHIITRGLKTTPTLAMETASILPSLDLC